MTSRLDTLLGLLDSDPGNLALISDAADAAIAERRPDAALDLLGRHEAIAPLSPQQANLAGLAAIQMKDFGGAAARFERLVETGVDDPSVRFNLAWSLAMEKQIERALELLDEDAAAVLPQAAMLKVQLLHEQGEFETAAERARLYVGMHPEHPGLMAAVSVLALDVEDEELARRCAAKAGDHPDALATLGTLALGEDRATDAHDMFDQALARNPGAPRAWVGRGLTKLLTGRNADAAADIDKGAEMFGDHLGSWIAAGWAHFVNQNLVAARERFETALQLDPTFAESHGSLAVLDLLDGRTDEARQRCETALRLDRNCYSGALAKSLLAADSGDQASARRIFEMAINMPVDGSGRTIAQSLSRIGLSAPSSAA